MDVHIQPRTASPLFSSSIAIAWILIKSLLIYPQLFLLDN
jgi:hypothetical protein